METLDQITLRLSGFITDYAESVGQPVDVSPGSALSELLVKLSAQLQQELLAAAEEPSSINTVQAALAAAEDTTSDAVAAVASNYNVARTAAVSAGGVIRVTVAFDRTYYLGSEFQLIHPNLSATFTTGRAYQVATGLSQQPEQGRLRLLSSGGTWYFLLPVRGLDGVHAAVPNNGALVLNPANTTLDGFVEARAFGPFNAGRPVETDRELIARFQTGLSARGLLSPRSMQVLLAEEFPSLFDQGTADGVMLSVVGANDPELQRGRNTTYGITPLGLADVYIRTGQTPVLESFPVTATRIEHESEPYWELRLDSSLPGFPSWFYQLDRVSWLHPDGAISLVTPLVKDIAFGYNPASPNLLTGGNFPPEQIARFTKHQVCTVRVPVLESPVPDLGSRRLMDVRVLYMPGIGDIQDYMLQSENRVVSADYLVRAVVPCLVSAQLNLVQGSGTPDLGALRKDIFNYANRLPFGQPLAASPMIDLAHNQGIRRVDLPVRLTGGILVPSTVHGATVSLADEDQLVLPVLPDLQVQGVSPRTTMFFLPHESVVGQSGLSVNLS